MRRRRARVSDWERFQRRADRFRSTAGSRLDPRERRLMVLSAVFLLATIAAYLMLTAQA